MVPRVTPSMKNVISSRERCSPSRFFRITSCGLNCFLLVYVTQTVSLRRLHYHSVESFGVQRKLTVCFTSQAAQSPEQKRQVPAQPRLAPRPSWPSHKRNQARRPLSRRCSRASTEHKAAS